MQFAGYATRHVTTSGSNTNDVYTAVNSLRDTLIDSVHDAFMQQNAQLSADANKNTDTITKSVEEGLRATKTEIRDAILQYSMMASPAMTQLVNIVETRTTQMLQALTNQQAQTSQNHTSIVGLLQNLNTQLSSVTKVTEERVVTQIQKEYILSPRVYAPYLRPLLEQDNTVRVLREVHMYSNGGRIDTFLFRDLNGVAVTPTFSPPIPDGDLTKIALGGEVNCVATFPTTVIRHARIDMVGNILLAFYFEEGWWFKQVSGTLDMWVSYPYYFNAPVDPNYYNNLLLQNPSECIVS